MRSDGEDSKIGRLVTSGDRKIVRRAVPAVRTERGGTKIIVKAAMVEHLYK